MPEYLRALIALLILTIPVMWWLRPQLTAVAIDPDDYRRRSWLWIGLTVCLFLAHSFWVFIALVAVALAMFGRKDSQPIGLYFFIVLLAPPLQALIPGFGGIRYFLNLDYYRLLSAAWLLPVAITLAHDPARARWFWLPADKYLVAYLLLLLLLQAPTTSGTDIVRSATSQILDVVLPYYVFSRGLTSLGKLRDAMASFVAAGVVLAVVATFESLKHWLLYSTLGQLLGVDYSFGGYMMREGSLRASATTGHAITLGYVLTVALGLHFALRGALPGRRAWWLVFGALGTGIVLSYSRGPWMGAAALLAVAVVLSPSAGKQIARTALAAVVVLPALPFTPFGQKIIALLPFVGQSDDGSVDYRKQLFTVSWDVLMLNPFFGSTDYMANASMEQMRQGEGIIDMVNSYLGVAMFSGFVGLSLFTAVFASIGWGLYRTLRRIEDKTTDDYKIGQALLLALIGILVTIATTSSINAVPVVYWCMAGAGAAYLSLRPVEAVQHEQTSTPRTSRQPLGPVHSFVPDDR